MSLANVVSLTFNEQFNIRRLLMSWKNKKALNIGLQFFAEGAEGGAQGGEGAPVSNAGENVSDDDMFLAEMEQKYGITDGVATAEARKRVSTEGQSLRSEEAEEHPEEEGFEAETENTSERTPEEEFDELIRGKYKDLYGKKVKEAISERFKNQKQTQEETDKLRGALSILASKYGLKPDDYDGIISAMENDDDLYEAEALRKNTTVEQLKEQKKQIKAKNASDEEIQRLRSELDERDRRDKSRQDAQRWAKEAKETKSKYEKFDLLSELKNPEFMKYLNSGMSVTKAFEHAHLDDILAAQMKAVEKRTAENVARSVAQNKGRIVEGARSPHSQTPAQARVNLRNMSDDDFEKIERLVNSGVRVGSDYFVK